MRATFISLYVVVFVHMYQMYSPRVIAYKSHRWHSMRVRGVTIQRVLCYLD